ncbi:MAG: PQQ-binding-like beta-propeller repeat protein [Myxococcales bacterium]|nr:PQQ-binding-like beta-propeller repeat protein [Myxococcales bacterium]
MTRARIPAAYAESSGPFCYVAPGFFVKGTNTQHVLAVDAQSGKELWRVPVESPGSFITSVSATAARVYVAIGDYLVAQTEKVVLDLGRGRED